MPDPLDYSSATRFHSWRYLRVSVVVFALALTTVAMGAVHLWLMEAGPTRASIVPWLAHYELRPARMAIFVAWCDIVVWFVGSCRKRTWSTAPNRMFWLRAFFDATSILSFICVPRFGES